LKNGQLPRITESVRSGLWFARGATLGNPEDQPDPAGGIGFRRKSCRCLGSRGGLRNTALHESMARSGMMSCSSPCRRRSALPCSGDVRRGDPRRLRSARRAVGRRRAAPAVPWYHQHNAGAGMGPDHCCLEAAARVPGQADPSRPGSAYWAARADQPVRLPRATGQEWLGPEVATALGWQINPHDETQARRLPCVTR
jgi:hypothetical protein